MTMVEHLEELRRRLIIVVAAIGIAAIAGFLVSGPAIDLLRAPLPDQYDTIYFNSLGGAFTAQLKIAGFIGVAIAMPVILFQLWRFVTPGLLPGERRLLWPFVVFGMVLFVAGVVIGYLLLPYAINFLLGFAREGVEPLLTIDEYIGFVTTLMLVFGLMLQFPIVLIILTRLGIVTPRFLASRRRSVIVLIAIVSAVATPGGDPFSMVMLSLFMYALFEITLVVVRGIQRDSKSPVAAESPLAAESPVGDEPPATPDPPDSSSSTDTDAEV